MENGKREVFLGPVLDVETSEDTFIPKDNIKRTILKYHNKPPLPPDWACHRSISYPDRFYFFNKKTKQSTWNEQEVVNFAKVKKVVSFNPTVKCQYFDAEDPQKSKVVLDDMCGKHGYRAPMFVGDREQDLSGLCSVESGVGSDHDSSKEGALKGIIVEASLATEQSPTSLAENQGVFTFEDKIKNHVADEVNLDNIVDRKHECKICSKSFRIKWHLAEHMVVHSGISPFQCVSCKKGFKRRKALETHLCIYANCEQQDRLSEHTSTQGVSLSLSNSRVVDSSREGTLDSSERGGGQDDNRDRKHSWSRQQKFDIKDLVNLQDGYHKCHFCDKQYNDRSNCKKHVLTAHLSMCWVCDGCGQKRKSMQAIKHHIRKSHGQDLGFHIEYDSRN